MHRTLRRGMLFLSETNVRQCLSMKDYIDVNRQAFKAIVNEGEAVVPPRLVLQYHAGSPGDVEDWTLFKPAAYQGTSPSLTTRAMGMKLASVRSQNPANGLPLVPATVLVVDPPTGMVEAVVSSTYLTGARTATGSALATGIAAPNAKHLVLFGAGLQAQTHIDAINTVLAEPLERITIISRTRPRAEQLAAQHSSTVVQTDVMLLEDTDGIRKALGEADVVVTCTNTTTPLFDGAWLKPGCHVNGVGSYTPAMQEVDSATVKRSTVWIDSPAATSVGDLKDCNNTGESKLVLLGSVLQNEDMKEKQANTDCTFFKSVGTAIQDVMTAALVVKRAKELGIGQEIDMS